MKTQSERRVEILSQRLKARCKADGTPRPGFEQNVAHIRAELEQISERAARREATEDGE